MVNARHEFRSRPNGRDSGHSGGGLTRVSFSHRFEYATVLALRWLACRLPLRAALWLGDRLGDIAFSVLRLRRRVTLANLRASFPQWPDERIEATARRNYRHFGRLAVEYLRIGRLSANEALEFVEIADPDVIQEVVSAGRGAVFISAHFGNWEYMGAALSAMGLPMWYLYQEQANPLVGELITRHRAHMQMRTIARGVAVRHVLRALRGGDFVAFLADQDAGRDGIFVDFLGRPASFARGPAIFSLKTGVPIIFSIAIRLPHGRHRAVFERIEVPADSAATEENVYALVSAYARRVEHYIRRYPDHWFWMHRRWKTVATEDPRPEMTDVAS